MKANKRMTADAIDFMAEVAQRTKNFTGYLTKVS